MSEDAIEAKELETRKNGLSNIYSLYCRIEYLLNLSIDISGF